MAKPINHDFTSTATSAGASAIKWGLGGLLLAAMVGGGLGLGAAALVGSWMGGASTTFLTVGTVIGTLTGGYLGTIPTLVGAAFGALSGTSRARDESEAYANLIEKKQGIAEQRQTDAQVASMQQGYMTGFQEGTQYASNVIEQQLMQAAQAQQAQLQNAPTAQAAQPKAVAGGLVAAAEQTNAKVTTECDTHCKSHAEKITSERAAAAAGGLQVS